MSVISIPYSFMAGGTDSDPEKYYVGYTDYYMKPSRPDRYATEILTHHATRAIALNPNLNGATGKNRARISPTWGMSMANQTEVRTGAEPRDRLSFGIDGEGVWGRSLQQVDGNETVILYDVPTKPLTSLGEFQHLNHQIFPWEPSYAIGNSRASPYILRDRVWNLTDRTHRGAEMHATQFDVSYLYNQALWDRYFLSSISSPADTGGYEAGLSMEEKIRRWEEAPLNPRVVPLPGSAQADRMDALSESRYTALGTQTVRDADVPHNRVAEFYGLAGAFNVNSVSVEAWKALLGSLDEGDISLIDEAGQVQTYTLEDLSVYFPRTALQGGNDASTSEMRWKGMGSLTEAQLQVFAENIVSEIQERSRRRGVPFASLAEFINREVDVGEAGRSGVIQAAIDAGDGVQSFNRNVLDAEGEAVKLDSGDESEIHILYNRNPLQVSRNNLPSPQVDQTFIPYPAPDHFQENSAAGISGYVSQADVLSVIGSQLTVRGDTFVVRGYGSVGTAGTGARAWCEAVVQRVPEYVDAAADAAVVHPENISSPVNLMFGRQFRIVSFRWLSPEEI